MSEKFYEARIQVKVKAENAEIAQERAEAIVEFLSASMWECPIPKEIENIRSIGVIEVIPPVAKDD